MCRIISLIRRWILLLCVVVLVSSAYPVLGQQAGSDLLISYQGRLTDDSGSPVADADHQLVFRLYDQKSGGSALWQETQTVTTSNGVFSAQIGAVNSLDGLAFDTPYYLAVEVDGSEELSPRTRLTDAPYAVRAHGIDDSTVTAGKIKNGAVTFDKLAQSGASSGDVLQWDGSSWTPVIGGGGSSGGWSLSGNSGTNPGSDFIGTTDEKALVLKVNGERALRIGPGDSIANIVAGHPANSIEEGVEASTIGGGGVAEYPNTVTSSFAVIGGGHNNTTSGKYATVGGGEGNTASAWFSTVSGGVANTAYGYISTVPGGANNVTRGDHSFAAGYGAKANHDGSFVWADSREDSVYSTGEDQFIVGAQGGVGIGTEAPANQFHVQGSVSEAAQSMADHVAAIENAATSGGPDVLALKMGQGGDPGTGANFLTFYDGDNDLLGQIEGNGSGGVQYSSAGADFAELLPLRSGASPAEPGDVVGTFGGAVSLQTSGADRVTVVSGQPAVLGNVDAGKASDASEKVPVSFVGQVRVRTIGSVDAGDLLVPSGRADGTARAVPAGSYDPAEHGSVIGQVWETDRSEGVRRVRTAVGVGSQAVVPTLASTFRKRLRRQKAHNQRQQVQIEKQREQIRQLQKRLASRQKTQNAKLKQLKEQVSRLAKQLESRSAPKAQQGRTTTE